MNTATRTLNDAETTSLAVLVAGATLLGSYGFATHSPNTIPYLLTIAVLAAAFRRLQRSAMPPTVTIGLACVAVAHLAGGLITVGDDVLYNAHAGLAALEYDHFVHTAAIYFGTIAVWRLVEPDVTRSRQVFLVSVLAGLGLGAANETIEFLMTVAHGGSHVGGYNNTGWDLVCNTVGALAAGAYVRRT
jgi:uncharacterized membrane protein YjdF